MNRMNLYRDIHKAIRALMADITVKSGRVDFASPASFAAFRADVESAFAFLSGHAEHENDFLDPAYRQFAPGVSSVLLVAHDEQEERMQRLTRDLASIDPKSADAPSKGHAVIVELSRFFGEVLVHMADEEQVGMPALWAAVDDAALLEIHRRLLASIGPEEMAVTLRLMIPAMNTPGRVELLAGMRAGAPAEVFNGVRAMAKSLIPAEEDAALERGLSAVVAA